MTFNANASFLELGEDVASDASNTYLSTLAGLAEDTNAVTSVKVPTSRAIQVRNFSAPTTVVFTHKLQGDAGLL